METFYFQYSNTSYNITANNNNGERQRCMRKRYSVNMPIHSFFIFLLDNSSFYGTSFRILGYALGYAKDEFFPIGEITTCTFLIIAQL